MLAASELERLLSLVKFDARLSAFEGLDAFRRLLEKDSEGRVLRFLQREMPKLEGKRQGGVAFVLAEHFRQSGDVKKLKTLFANDDPTVKQYVLNALWGEPGANPETGPALVELAIQGAGHASEEVRAEACSVIQNQAAWKVDVTKFVPLLPALLDDASPRVRQQAAYAAGNLARSRYELPACLAPLRRNLKHEVVYVREAGAWALWQFSRSKHDIGPAAPELVRLLTDADDYAGPRKNAAGALLHHAKKSPQNAAAVKKLAAGAALDERRKEIKRFIYDLGKLK